MDNVFLTGAAVAGVSSTGVICVGCGISFMFMLALVLILLLILLVVC